MSEDFKEGYRQGFLDGLETGKALKENKNYLYPFGELKAVSKCSVCGTSFVDEKGNLRVMGYVCNHLQCPSKMTLT